MKVRIIINFISSAPSNGSKAKFLNGMLANIAHHMLFE